MATRKDKKSPNIFFRFYWNDYNNNTSHLTLLQHGAYEKLIINYYSTGKPLPEDHDKVFRMVGAFTQDERNAVTSVLQEFFSKEAGTYRNSRCDEELERIANERNKNSANGKHGGSANSPAQMAYRQRGSSHDSDSDSEHDSKTIATAIKNDSEHDSNSNSEMIASSSNSSSIIEDAKSQNDDQAVAAAFLEEKHLGDIGAWGTKHRPQMKAWIKQHGQAFMDEAITKAKANNFDGARSKFAVLVTTYLPQVINQFKAEREQVAKQKKADEFQAASIKRQTDEIVARRDARPPVSEVSIEQFMAAE
jgi:uncharacterized protein YdaU (DUF1376 family)